MKFIREILDRAEKFRPQDDTLIGTKVQEGEKVLGEVPPELRGLFVVMLDEGEKFAVLADQLKANARAVAKTADDKPPKESRAALNAILQEVVVPENNLKTIRDMFWSSVRRAVPGAAVAEEISLRKGWKIVACEPRKTTRNVHMIEIPMPGDLAGLLAQLGQ